MIGPRLDLMKLILFSYMLIAVHTFFTPSDARFSKQMLHYKNTYTPGSMLVEPNLSKHVKINSLLKPINAESHPYGMSSPASLPPLDSFNSPLSLPDNKPPFCINPPSPSTSTILPSPMGRHTPSASPPPFAPIENPPPYEPTPPKHAPSPPGPLAYLPPTVPSSPRHKNPQFAVWCVAKPTVPDSIIQEALDYACVSGADCKAIQPNGACFQPNTLVAHASYAFNSYWQNTKVRGGTCDFGGAAMLVTIDPSFEDCNFINH